MQRPDASTPMVELPEGRGSRSQRRVARIVSPLLRRVLRNTERSLTVVEAVRVASWLPRLVLGSSWVFGNRVALVFTDRRLLEVALVARAGRAPGDVREIVWNGVALPRIDGGTLRVGDHSRWWLRHPVDDSVLEEIVEAAVTATTHSRRGISAQEWRLCAHCGATMRDRDSRCQRCGARRASPGLARLLTLAFPGAGMLYLGRTGHALLRCLTELVLWLVFAERMLRADGLAMQLVVAVGFVVALVLVKAEGVHMTRLLAARAGAAEPTLDDAAWRRRGLAGLLLSLAGLALPIMLAGSMSSGITGDLDANAEYLGWDVSRRPGVWSRTEAGMRAEWHHDSGLLVRALARPLGPFTSARRARLRWVDDYGREPGVAVKRLDLGSRRVLRVTQTVRPPGEATRVTLRYLLVDDYGRDEHTLVANVVQAELAGAERVVEQLLSCLYWIPARSLDADDGSAPAGSEP